MSAQGLQRTQQVLNVIGQQLPSIAQASETEGINLAQFIHGALTRSGVQLFPEVAAFVSGLVVMIGTPTVQKIGGAELPVMDSQAP